MVTYFNEVSTLHKSIVLSFSLASRESKINCSKFQYKIYFQPDINECEENPQVCGASANCTNTDGSHTCACVTGFEMVQGSCQGEFKSWLKCTGLMDAVLELKLGFAFDFLSACDSWVEYILVYVILDINECDDNNGNCTDNSNCFNIRGSYECRCKDGYSWNATTEQCDGKGIPTPSVSSSDSVRIHWNALWRLNDNNNNLFYECCTVYWLVATCHVYVNMFDEFLVFTWTHSRYTIRLGLSTLVVGVLKTQCLLSCNA